MALAEYEFLKHGLSTQYQLRMFRRYLE